MIKRYASIKTFLIWTIISCIAQLANVLWRWKRLGILFYCAVAKSVLLSVSTRRNLSLFMSWAILLRNPTILKDVYLFPDLFKILTPFTEWDQIQKSNKHSG